MLLYTQNGQIQVALLTLLNSLVYYPLQSGILADKIISISVDVSMKYKGDLKYLCTKNDTEVPILPVLGEDEYKLFNRLLMEMNGVMDDMEMAIHWCDHVNGPTIFPKLPVYL